MKNKKGMIGAVIGIILILFIVFVAYMEYTGNYDPYEADKELCNKIGLEWLKTERSLITTNKVVCWDSITKEIKIIP